MSGSARWWREVPSYAWLVLFVAWLGWVFDIADTALFNFAKGPMMEELVGRGDALKEARVAVEGRIQTIFILGWSLGGLIFGVLADRWGRTRTMTLTILVYCAFTGLTALCQTVDQVAAVRFVTGLGIGGEWAAGASLVAEVFPDRARPGAAAFLQTAAAVGPVLAGLANQALAGESWRWLFVVGLAPAAITVLIRLYVREPERWRRAVASAPGSALEPLRRVFGHPRWRKHAILAMVIGMVGIAGAGNLSFWLPNLVEEASAGLSEAVIAHRKSIATYWMHVGTVLGVFFFPWLCERIGRKRAFFAFFVGSPASVALALYSDVTYHGLLVMAPLMAFFMIGLSSGFGLWFPELFPTALRATGCGLAYNTARIGQAPWPWVTALIIGSAEGNVARGVLLAAGVYLIGLAAIPFSPETKGKSLPDS